jgi:phosphoketolase
VTRTCSGGSSATWRKRTVRNAISAVFGPDETISNGLEALFEVTARQWGAATDGTTNSSRAPDA